MLIAVIGNFGTGKTICLTYFALINYIKKKMIFSNYHLFDPIKSKYIEKPEEIKDIRWGVALLDEFWFWFDSRCPKTKRNLMMSYIIANFRKRGLDMIYSLQDLGQIDKRLRNWTDCIIEPRGSNFVYIPELNDYSPLIMRMLFYSKQGWIARKPFKIVKFQTRPLWNLYDTSEEICVVN